MCLQPHQRKRRSSKKTSRFLINDPEVYSFQVQNTATTPVTLYPMSNLPLQISFVRGGEPNIREGDSTTAAKHLGKHRSISHKLLSEYESEYKLEVRGVGVALAAGECITCHVAWDTNAQTALLSSASIAAGQQVPFKGDIVLLRSIANALVR